LGDNTQADPHSHRQQQQQQQQQMAELSVDEAYSELARQHPQLFAFLASAARKKRRLAAGSASVADFDEDDSDYAIGLAAQLETQTSLVLETIVSRLPYSLIEAMCRASFRLAYRLCGTLPDTGDRARTRERRAQLLAETQLKPQPEVWLSLLARDFGLGRSEQECTIEYTLARGQIAYAVTELILTRIGGADAERTAGYKRLYESLLRSAATGQRVGGGARADNTLLLKTFGYYELAVYGCYRGLAAVRLRYTASRLVADVRNDLYIVPLPCVLNRFARTSDGEMVAAILDEDEEDGFVARTRLDRIRAYLATWALYREDALANFNANENPFVSRLAGAYFINAVLPAQTTQNVLYTDAGLFLGGPRDNEPGPKGFVAYDAIDNARDALSALGLLGRAEQITVMAIARLLATALGQDEVVERLETLRADTLLPSLRNYQQRFARDDNQFFLVVSKNGKPVWRSQALPAGFAGFSGLANAAVCERYYAAHYNDLTSDFIFAVNRDTGASRLLRLAFARSDADDDAVVLDPSYSGVYPAGREVVRLHIDNDSDTLHILLFLDSGDESSLVWASVRLTALFFGTSLRPRTVETPLPQLRNQAVSYTIRPYDGVLLWEPRATAAAITLNPDPRRTVLALHLEGQLVYEINSDDGGATEDLSLGDSVAGADVYHWATRRHQRTGTHNTLPGNVAVQTEALDQLRPFAQPLLANSLPDWRVRLVALEQ
jgi:hypothetical protein